MFSKSSKLNSKIRSKVNSDFMTYLLAVVLVVAIVPKAQAETVKLERCLTAEIDTANLNALNAQANKIFPYTLEKVQVDGLTQVTPAELRDRYIESLKSKDSEAQYLKLVDNVKIFLLSGGILIKTVDDEIIKNRGGGACGIYNQDEKFPNLFSEVPNINQLLTGAFANVMIQASAKHQEKFLGRAADTVFFLVFGYSGWGAKNRAQFAEFDEIVKCTVDDMNQANRNGNIVCDETMSKELAKNFKLFFASSIMNFLFIKDFTKKPEFTEATVSYGFFGDYLSKSSEAREKLRERPWTGGAASDLAEYGDYVLANFYRASNAKKETSKQKAESEK